VQQALTFDDYKISASLSVFWRLLAQYLFLVGYLFAYVYVLKYDLARVYGYLPFRYDDLRWADYDLVCLLLPLATLPAGTKLEAPGQFIFVFLCQFLLFPTPVLFLAHVPRPEFWQVFVMFWLGMAILSAASRASFPSFVSPLSQPAYKRLIIGTVALFVVLLGHGMMENFQIVGFDKIYEVRYGEDAVSTFSFGIVHTYVFSFGGLFVALSLLSKRYGFAFIATATYVICYGIAQLKTAALGPFWIFYAYFCMTKVVKTSMLRYYICLSAPFLFGFTLILLFPDSISFGGGNLVVFFFTNLINYRLYSIPGEAFTIYTEFFSTHPPTYWSHINGVNFFLHYPYSGSIAEELKKAFDLGNYNASYLSTDAIAAVGYEGIPLASAALGLVFMLANAAGRGLNRVFLGVTMIMPAVMLLERPLTTSLLTGGIAFLILYIAWTPRDMIREGA
jgi:hypothetical protein